MDISKVKQLAEKVSQNVARVIVGKEEITELALICLIGGGHMLLEDVPGTGKTVFSRALAKSISASFRRIQFTPDLLPSDVTGIHYYNQKENEFILRKGPVFTNILLADEINRATPRTQSALLESMEEKQVTIDNDTLLLAPPFFVMATQNPVEIQGTFPLPEAQLDRFLVKAAMGYPSKEEGKLILSRFKEENPLATLEPVADSQDVNQASQCYPHVRISDDILYYIIEIAERTRVHQGISLGVSPRGTQALMRACQIRAAIRGRDYVMPDDVKALARPVFSHRIIATASGGGTAPAERLLAEVLNAVPVPKEKI